MKLCVILFLAFLLASCNTDKKFDESLWEQQANDGFIAHRNAMISDLITNYRIKGISYQELIKLLGKQDGSSSENENEIYYDIKVEYGFLDIDPVFAKTLNIKFDKDSIVTDFKIVEWKK